MDGDLPHQHCDQCFKLKCTARLWPPDGCAMTDCEYDCGARFHTCKKKEHSLLCRNERVSCLNCENGCPLVFPRWQLGIHLQTCPASVMVCTMEWNRWPVYSRERQAKLPFTQHQMHLRYGQLDVALAMRDQRMLNESMKAPRHTRRTLRNNLTRRFPAVPIVYHRGHTAEHDTETGTSAETSRTVSDDECDAPWERAKMPPGLQKSMCRKLYSATKQATDSLSDALDAAIDGPSDGMLSNISETNDVQNAENGNDLFQYQVDVEEEQEITADSYDVNGDITHDSNRVDGEMMTVVDVDTLENRNSLSMSPLPVDHSHAAQTEPDHSIAPHIPTPPHLGHFLNYELLGLDLNVESITRYQAKPSSMYTFLCLQEFRRDEYPNHFCNVHGSIQCGLNGWMEQRCPLSQYGCTHSIKRFYPKPDGCITHSSLLESFGLRTNVAMAINQSHERYKSPSLESFGSRERTPDIFHSRSPSKSKESTPEIFISQKYNAGVIVNKKKSHVVSPNDHKLLTSSLTSLPFEVLRYIGSFLDGFSLNNLSLTCHLLRDVCSSMLEERGIVTQQWERVKEEGCSKWVVGFQRWTFSVCFSPVHDWGFTDHEPLGEHLKTCQFNKRNTKTEPYQFPMGCDILRDEIVQKLYRSAGLEWEPELTEGKEVESTCSQSGSGDRLICVAAEDRGSVTPPPDQIQQGCSEDERRKTADLNQAMPVDAATLVS
ncbi:F-box only protein 30-like isoform X2 [Lineus longissimus]